MGCFQRGANCFLNYYKSKLYNKLLGIIIHLYANIKLLIFYVIYFFLLFNLNIYIYIIYKND
jgi:hypothetical protein